MPRTRSSRRLSALALALGAGGALGACADAPVGPSTPALAVVATPTGTDPSAHVRGYTVVVDRSGGRGPGSGR